MTLPTALDDVRLFLDALKVLLSGYSIFRKRKGEPNAQAQKEEHVIDRAIQTAETEMGSPDVDSQRVAQGLEERLQAELGTAAKEAIIQRALGIMALAHPYEVESFRYHEVLAELLAAARAFFLANNVFKLRGESEDGGRFLILRKLSSALKGLLERSGYFEPIFRADRRVFDVSVDEVLAMLRTESEGSRMAVYVKTRNSDSMGGTYTERFLWGLALVAGTEVNRLGFHVERYPQYLYSRDFDLRITLEELKGLALAVVGDLTDFASELSQEERSFRDDLGPALTQVLAPIRTTQHHSANQR